MSRLRRLAILLGVVGLTLSISSQAWAKEEGSYLAFDRLYYSPGEEVHLQTDFRANMGGLPGTQLGSVEDGPFHAYLLPLRKFIHPPEIPKTAVFLGTILIERGKREGEWSASISFVMPQVKPGDYWVDYCNDPCQASGVGDLGGGSFRVVTTAEEARLMNLLDEWVNKLIAEQIVPVEVDESDLATLRVKEALRDTRTRLELTEQLEGLRTEMTIMSAELSARDENVSDLGPGLWLAGWLVAAGIAALWLASWRRQRSSEGGQARPAAT
jgi:hypothetical protein